MTRDEASIREIVEDMLANPRKLYSRVSNGFAISAGEVFAVEDVIRGEILHLRTRADELESALAQVKHHAKSWYEIIRAERDEAQKL